MTPIVDRVREDQAVGSSVSADRADEARIAFEDKNRPWEYIAVEGCFHVKQGKAPDVAERRRLPLGQFRAHPGRRSPHAGLPRDRKHDAGKSRCALSAKHAYCRFSESVDQVGANGIADNDQLSVVRVRSLRFAPGC